MSLPHEHIEGHLLKKCLHFWKQHSSRLLNQMLTWELSLVNQFLTEGKNYSDHCFPSKSYKSCILHLEGQLDLFFTLILMVFSPSFFCLFFYIENKEQDFTAIEKHT